jgi:uncharacterized iron-regulated membrane protein
MARVCAPRRRCWGGRPRTSASARGRTLHSRLLQGDRWRWMIELAASWLFVMLLAGVAPWRPRNGQFWLPRRGRTGRRLAPV